MKLNFREWLKMKPKDLQSYYLKQSTVAIVVALLMLLFQIIYGWLNSPYKVLTTDNNLLLPLITLDLLSVSIAEIFNSFVFGVYDFLVYTGKMSVGVLNYCAFIGVPFFLFLSLLFGFIAGFSTKNNKVIALYSVLLAILVGGFFVANAWVFVPMVILIPLANYVLKKKKEEVKS